MQEKRQSFSRTDAATKNLVVGVASKIILLGATFLVRTIFIRVLGVEYTGISSLFSNILSFLSLAELGMGSVLTYELYRPLRDKDSNTVAMYVALFQKIYLVVIAAILGVGLLLTPFLKVITHSTLPWNYLLLYYFLYLTDSVASYFVVYRTTVIDADQKRYVTQSVEIASKLVMYVCQSVYLLVRRDFVGYLCIQVTFTVVRNVVLHQLAAKMYPYLKEKPTQKLEGDKVRSIFKNVSATFVARLSNVALTQTDSIIISALFGVLAVGYYTNYNMIIVYVNSIYYLLYVAIEASVGNVNAEENAQKSYQLYKKISLTFGILNTFCIVGYAGLIQDFISVWIGKQYLQSGFFIACLLFSLYMNQTMNTVSMYRQTMGLFKEAQKIYPLMAVTNIILSIILGKLCGIAGVALATGLSRLLTAFWFEGKLVFEKLEKTFGEYIRQQFKFAIYTILSLAICLRICTFIPWEGVFALITKGLLIIVGVGAVSFLFFGRTSEWKWAIGVFRKKILSR